MKDPLPIAELLPAKSSADLFNAYNNLHQQVLGAMTLRNALPIDRPSEYDRLMDAKIAAMQAETDVLRAQWQASLPANLQPFSSMSQTT